MLHLTHERKAHNTYINSLTKMERITWKYITQNKRLQTQRDVTIQYTRDKTIRYDLNNTKIIHNMNNRRVQNNKQLPLHVINI